MPVRIATGVEGTRRRLPSVRRRFIFSAGGGHPIHQHAGSFRHLASLTWPRITPPSGTPFKVLISRGTPRFGWTPSPSNRTDYTVPALGPIPRYRTGRRRPTGSAPSRSSPGVLRSAAEKHDTKASMLRKNTDSPGTSANFHLAALRGLLQSAASLGRQTT